jgi:AcrR family transcriptional regulator
MARRTPQEAAQTRQALLMAALEVFSERGATTATLKDVAARAGVTHGALYWHFKNREALLEGVFQQVPLPFDRHYLEQLQASRQQALAALEAYLLGLLREIAGDVRIRRAYRLFYTGSDNGDAVVTLAGQRQRALAQCVGHIHYFLKQARKQQLTGLKKSQLEPMARSICCLLLGVMQAMLLDPELFSCKEQGPLLVRSCLRGL